MNERVGAQLNELRGGAREKIFFVFSTTFICVGGEIKIVSFDQG